MPARALIVGLDGFDLHLVRQFGPERLPHLHALMASGAYAALESVQPPATLPNWTTFLTGLDPGRHGVFDFTTRKGYQVRFSAGTVRAAPTVFQLLDRLGLRCACLSFPATWPPEKLRNGIFVSGWDAPVAFEADSSFMWPPSLYEETVRKFGIPSFDDVDEFAADRSGWIEELPQALRRRTKRKAEWSRWLLEKQDWDVFAVYFGESDTAAHYLWAHHDPRSPRRPTTVLPELASALGDVYSALDEAVGSLVDAAGGEQTEVTVLSDHGSGGSSDKVLYLNRLLAQHGLLHFRKRRVVGSARLKELALRRFPPPLRERVFRFGNAWLPSLLESRVRFGAVDMRRTVAFSDELNYFPAIHLNLKGREPNGILRQDEVRDTVARIRTCLLETRDPWTGRPVFRDVIAREELFEGPFVGRAPDLLLDLHLDGGYSYNLMPSARGPSEPSRAPTEGLRGGSFRKLANHEKQGKKGRSLPGSHRSRGFMALAGPRIRSAGKIDAHIADLTATLLCRLGIRVPSSFKGRVLWEALRDDRKEEPLQPMPSFEVARGESEHDAALVESRLRALGYVE